MKTASFGRIVFGASAVLFGVICLMWHDADTWQYLTRLWKLPFGTALGGGLMIAQIAGGLLLAYPRSARLGSILLGIVYGLFSLLGIPPIVAAPRVAGEYFGFFEQFCLLCGAIAVYALTQASAARATAFGRAARIGLGVCAVWFMLGQALFLTQTASLVPTWMPPNQMFWAILTTVAFGLAALALLTHIQARLATRLMTAMLVIFGVIVWIPLVIAHPATHGNWSEFALTALIAGASWTVAELPVP